VSLRPAKGCDSEFAYQTKKAAFRQYAEMVWGWDEAEQRALHERRFASQEFQIVQVSNADVGILAIAEEPCCVKLNQLYILPEYQGKGIGEACMKQIIADAQRTGLPVRLQALKVNARAIAFYRRLGFTDAGESDTHVLLEIGG
jgi:GNAT superfamily N-acetyltransferase